MSTVVFVCAHGALKSRLAAAFFNAVAPPGWRASSAGLEPQQAVSVHAAPLMAGTAAEPLLERHPPQPMSTADADRLIAIDCAAPGAHRWDLAHDTPGEAMRDELRRLAEALAVEIRDGR